jgi:DNA-binding beta-propeller fold protein YncE
MYQKIRKILAFAFLGLTACVKDKPEARLNTSPVAKQGVFVVCEGQYTVGNSSLYLYQPNTDSVFGDLFAAANSSSVGDVLQSMTLANGRFLLCVNNSQKVLVLDTATFQVVKQVAISYPRYICSAGGQIFVSTLYSNRVYVLGNDFSVIDSVLLPAKNPENMCVWNNHLFVACWDTATQQLYRVDLASHKLLQQIAVGGRAPHDVALDKEGMLWVLSGNQAKGSEAALTRLDPSTGNILSTLVFPRAAEPVKLTMNQARDTLYYINVNYDGGTTNNGIFRIGINQRALPSIAFINAVKFQYFWAIGISPTTGDIFVGDPKGFNQRGEVLIYNTDGVLKRSMKVGVGPSSFLFI